MSLLEFKKTGPAAYAVSDGFGALWDQAEKLGKVELRTALFGGPKYEAQIRFSRKSGTSVFATGKSDDRDDALRRAISEAVELGAEDRTP